MARSRNIKPGFFENDLLAEIEPLGRLLFAGLWTIADREGRLEERIKRIKAKILPYDNCNVDHLLNELEKREFIIRYEADGNHYIQIVNFLKHQSPHMKEPPSEIPAPDKYQTSMVQEPDKNNYSPPDSLKLIPDSFNSINTADENSADIDEPSSKEIEDKNNKSPSQVIALTVYKQLENIGIKKNSKWVGKQIGLANDLLKRYSFDEINKVIEWGFSDSFYRKIFNGLEKYDQILQAMKGGADNGRTRTHQNPDRRSLTAEDYDEPQYRDLIRAHDRKLEREGVLKMPPADQELP